MKLGTVFIVYVLGVILAAVGRLQNLMLWLLITLGAFAVIGIIGLLFRSDSLVNLSIRWGTKVLVVLSFGFVATLTWKGLFGIIFK